MIPPIILKKIDLPNAMINKINYHSNQISQTQTYLPRTLKYKEIRNSFDQSTTNTIHQTLCQSAQNSGNTLENIHSNQLSAISATKKPRIISNYGNSEIGEVLPKEIQSGNSFVQKFTLINSVHIYSQEYRELHNRKNEFKILNKWSYFSDYIFLRDPNFSGYVPKIQENHLKQQKNFFMTDREEKDYLNKKRSLAIFQFKEKSNFYQTQKKLSKSESSLKYLSFIQITDQLQSNYPDLQENSIGLVEQISSKVKVEEIDVIQTHFNDLSELFQNSGMVKFYLLTEFINCLILTMYQNYSSSYRHWKKFIKVCNEANEDYHKYKLIAYKYLAKCCQQLGEYEKSIIYLIRLLKLSWVLGNKDFELLSYDMISIVYYYLGKIQQSLFFHDKFVNGQFEEKDSYSRQLGFQSYQLGQKLKISMNNQNSYSDDEFNLDSIIDSNNLAKWQNQSVSKESTKLVHEQKIKQLFEPPIFIGYKQKVNQIGQLLKKTQQSFSVKSLMEQQFEIDPFNKINIIKNQLSRNRDTKNHVIQIQTLDFNERFKSQDDKKIFYKPTESIKNLNRMIRVFKDDIIYFCQNGKLQDIY